MDKIDDKITCYICKAAITGGCGCLTDSAGNEWFFCDRCTGKAIVSYVEKRREILYRKF